MNLQVEKYFSPILFFLYDFSFCTNRQKQEFFQFYNSLNKYAKNTRKFDYDVTAKFRDVLATAKDPCKAFLEDIPAVLGYNNLHNEEFTAQYLQLIKTAVHELVICYDLFIDRIEKTVVGYLGLPHDYIEYKDVLVRRYSSINKGLLTAKSKSFLDRVLAPSDNKREFYEKIGLVIFDRKIETIEDSHRRLWYWTVSVKPDSRKGKRLHGSEVRLWRRKLLFSVLTKL